MLGVISLSSVDFDVNSRTTSPESTDLTVRNATGSSVTTQDFPLITLSQHDNDFAVRNGTRSSVNRIFVLEHVILDYLLDESNRPLGSVRLSRKSRQLYFPGKVIGSTNQIRKHVLRVLS